MPRHNFLEDFFAKICQELARTNGAACASTSTCTLKRYSVQLKHHYKYAVLQPCFLEIIRESVCRSASAYMHL